MSNKKAVIVGINYPNTNNELKGCVNDALLMEKVLRTHYDFKDVTLLLDAAAHTDAILMALNALVKNAEPGDVLYFHYSGHGSQMLDDADDDYELDGLDEIICPIDLNWNDKVIRDDDLKEIFNKVPNGVNLTVMLDCCNSGGGLDQLNQYQPLGEASKNAKVLGGRFLPPPNLKLEEKVVFKPKAIQHKNVNGTSLLISGCQSHQTSADAYIDGRYQGAATYACTQIMQNHNYELSYKTLIEEMNSWMAEIGFTQRPELNGPSVLFNRSVLDGYSVPEVQSHPVFEPQKEEPVIVVSLEPIKEDKNTDKLSMIIGGVLLVVGLLVWVISIL